MSKKVETPATDNGLVPLPPLGAYLAAYFRVCRHTLALTMGETAATTHALTMSSWKMATRGIMALLAAPVNLSKAASKKRAGKLALTTEQHLERLYFGDAAEMAAHLQMAKEARITWDKSRDFLKVQHGWDVGPMPSEYPERLRARIEAQASADATDAGQAGALAQVTGETVAEAIPAATVLVPVTPGSPVMMAVEAPITVEPVALDETQGGKPTVPADDAPAGDAPSYTEAETVADPLAGDTPMITGDTTHGGKSDMTADAGQAGEPTPEPVCEHASQTSEPVAEVAQTGDAPRSDEPAPVEGERADVPVAGASDAGATEPTADAKCAVCEPAAVVVVTPAGVAAFSDAPMVLDGLPAGETEPVSAPLGDGPSVAEAGTAEPTGPTEPAVSATDGTPQNGDAPVAGDAGQGDAPEGGSHEGAAGAEGESPLPETAAAHTECAAADGAGQPESGSVADTVGTATQDPASPLVTEPVVSDASVPLGSGDPASAEAGNAEPQSADNGIVGDASMATVTVDMPRVVSEPGPEHAALAEFDARLAMAWAEHMQGPCEASARTCRAIAREAYNSIPKLFGAVDLHKWREKTRAWIPQTNNLGRTSKLKTLTVAHAEASAQEAAVTPAQEEASAIAAEARATMLGSAADAGVVLPDEGRPTSGVNS